MKSNSLNINRLFTNKQIKTVLLNRNKETYFYFEVISQNENKVLLPKITNVGYIFKEKYLIKFRLLNNSILDNNLKLIDSSLTLILSEVILIYHRYETVSIKEIATILSNKNPLNIESDIISIFYSHKIKELLLHFALGMKGNYLWDGNIYNYVRIHYKSVCFNAYEEEKLKEFLFNNTIINSNHTSKSYIINDKQFIKLDLKIKISTSLSLPQTW